MKVTDITVEVRSIALGRIGGISADYLTDMKIIKRYNNVGFWSMSLPAELDEARELEKPGRGIVVTGPNGRILLSGRTQNTKRIESATDLAGKISFIGSDDMIHIADALAWPEPSNDNTETQTAAHDVRTGLCETVMRAYVDANIGQSATSTRKIAGLGVDVDQGRGAVVTGRARFIQLGELLNQLGSVGGLGFDVEQRDEDLVFVVYEPKDKSKIIRMDIENNMLVSTERGRGAPTATRAIVAGQGQGEERRILQITDTAAQAAEVQWGRKIEVFKDRRDTEDDVELIQSGEEIVINSGRTLTTLSVVPSDSLTMEYGIDWFLGDVVTVVVDDQELSAVVTEAIISITVDGVRTAATIGDPSNFDYESRMIAKQERQEIRLAFLEKNAESSATDLGPIEGDILALDSRVGVNEGDIAALEASAPGTPGIPYAMAAGGAHIPAAASNNGNNVTVTFPSGRFTEAPIVTVAVDNSSRYQLAINSVTTSGFTVRADNFTSGTAAASTANWHAVQMTSGSASG